MKYEYPLYLTFDEYTSGGEPEEPGERWTSYTPTYMDFTPTGLYKDRNSIGVFCHGLMEDEVKGEFELGDIAHLLIVRYSTGNTFGTTYGYWHVEGVYADSTEAALIKTVIENETYDGYKPWEGYFERLESVQIYPLIIQ